jgi:hypothetical protein
MSLAGYEVSFKSGRIYVFQAGVFLSVESGSFISNTKNVAAQIKPTCFLRGCEKLNFAL